MQIECLKTRIIVAVLTHLVYFFLGATAAFFILLRIEMGSRDNLGADHNAPWLNYTMPLVLASGVVGLLCSSFGPYLYKRHIMRGRGTLEEVRSKSQYTGPNYNQKNGVSTNEEES